MITFVFGTTGELIKIYPVLKSLDERENHYELWCTGQQFEEVPQAQPPLSRHVSNSNAEEFAMDTDTADDFCVEDDEQPVPKNPPVLETPQWRCHKLGLMARQCKPLCSAKTVKSNKYTRIRATFPTVVRCTSM